jgi:alkylation response protein AidB-like acyl-CoA dehydrogenase
MSRALQPRPDLTVLIRQIALAGESAGIGNHLDVELTSAVLEEAARFAYAELEPLNAREYESAPAIHDGHVRLSPDHIAAWKTFAGGGWLGLDTPEDAGGQGLPTVLAVSAQELFDRSCAAFGMLGVSTRSAVRLINAYADQAVRTEWVPPLLAGDWGATICISEVGAGSDLARIRTRARTDAGGTWRIAGEKNWISFGDHNATQRIGHCVLAQTQAGLSLFLVPNSWDGAHNGVVLRRLEKKLGLHLSPTCALGFENARAILLGAEGRGLAQMFVMITNMRLNVGADMPASGCRGEGDRCRFPSRATPTCVARSWRWSRGSR